MKKKFKQKIFFFACDYSANTGEGRLGRRFIYQYENENNCKAININKIKIRLLNYKYIVPLIGIIYLWFFYLKKKKIIYLNYLPMWNSIIFLFLPPNTILGPITGGANFNRSNKLNYLLRKYIFPIFYKISEKIINFRFQKIIFSTNLLKKYLNNTTIQKSNFNFVLKNIKLKKINFLKKKNDFLIYYRDHRNKKSLFSKKIISKLIKMNFKVIIVGDKLRIPGVINKGYISNKSIQNLQLKTKFTVSSGENLYTLFVIECIENGVKVLINHNKKKEIKYFKNKFRVINFNNNYSIKHLKKLKN